MATKKWVELALSACDDAGIQADMIETIITWEQTFLDNDAFRHNAVFRLGNQRILKIFGTDAQRHVAVERSVLQTLDKGFPAPHYIADGQLEDGTPYLIMSEIEGLTLEYIWMQLSSVELRAVARQIGIQTAELHQYPQGKLAQVEAIYHGREHVFKEMEAERIQEIKLMDSLSTRHKDELFKFIDDESQTFLDVPPVLTHSDLSHAHIYLTRQNNQTVVAGWIDLGAAMLGPPEWDITFHWFWTFSQNEDMMRECLNAYYQHFSPPDQFARRCFVTHFYTFSMREVWDYFTQTVKESESIVRALITTLYPPKIFGPPD